MTWTLLYWHWHLQQMNRPSQQVKSLVSLHFFIPFCLQWPTTVQMPYVSLHSFLSPRSMVTNFAVHTTPLHTWPTLKNFLFIRGIWRYLTAVRLITGCWVGWSGFRCDTPGSSWKPLLSSYIAGWSCFFTLAVPKQFMYPVWGQEPNSLMHTNHRLLSEEGLFSPAYYYAVGTSGYAVKCHITSVALWLDYLYTSVFIFIEDNS
jgi:hypothetical protein